MEGGMNPILVVEDDDGIRGLLVEMLGRLGFETVTAANGEEGLTAFRKQPMDMVVTDIRMPVMDGLTMLKQIRRENAIIPIVVVTAFPSVDSAVESLSEGADDYLVKPINLNDLENKVRKAMERRQIQRALSRWKRAAWILTALIPLWFLLGILISKGLG